MNEKKVLLLFKRLRYYKGTILFYAFGEQAVLTKNIFKYLESQNQNRIVLYSFFQFPKVVSLSNDLFLRISTNCQISLKIKFK